MFIAAGSDFSGGKVWVGLGNEGGDEAGAQKHKPPLKWAADKVITELLRV